MKNEADLSDLVIVSNDSGLTRWAPLVVVLGVVAGFVTLSWYAYHAGIQSVKEEDLVVVEADKTPMKEKPSDPGGMQFPNQDKTVFETFSGNSKQPPKVERVLPVPEEPMAKEKDPEASGTTTWVNKDIAKTGTEQVIGKDKDTGKKMVDKSKVAASVAAPDEKPVYTIKDPKDHQVIAAQSASDDEQSVTYVAPKKGAAATKAADKALHADEKPAIDKPAPFTPEKAEAIARATGDDAGESAPPHDDVTSEDAPKENTEKANKEAEKPAAFAPSAAKEVKEEKPVAKAEPEKKAAEKKEPAKKSAAPETHVAANGGHFMVQLGAYRSEDEANDTWEKMHLKHKDLSDKKPVVVRADLGSKGIYYRLRVGGLSSAADAKALCHALSSKGQACLIPTDK